MASDSPERKLLVKMKRRKELGRRYVGENDLGNYNGGQRTGISCSSYVCTCAGIGLFVPSNSRASWYICLSHPMSFD